MIAPDRNKTSRKEKFVADQDQSIAASIDTTKPSIARAYDVVLGGKDNFAIDRAIVGEMLKIVPQLPEVATYNRQVLSRGVRYLVEEAGIRQFMDLGSGLPTRENTHQVAQRSAPEARVVYVDNDRCKSGCGHAWSLQL